MICNDCVHWEACKGLLEAMNPDYKSKNIVIKHHCERFKNKDDFVEVVRCSQCKHLTVHNSPTLYAYCEKEHIRFEPFQKDTRTHFCSYGEKE